MPTRSDVVRLPTVSPPAGQGHGWIGLFKSAFRDSRNPMALIDASRVVVDVNGALLSLLGHRRGEIVGKPTWEFVSGGPMMTPAQWDVMLDAERFTGDVELVAADGHIIAVQWAATPEMITGQKLVLLVALSTSRWGGRFRRAAEVAESEHDLSSRELEILRLVAKGQTGPEIADELHIAHNTVRTHVRNAMTKTGARSRAHLVAKAFVDGHALP